MLMIPKFKAAHKLRKPSGRYAVGCIHLMFEYTQKEKDEKKRLIPCLCFYPANQVDEGTLKKYVSEQILPGTEGIETNSYLNAPISEGKHPLLLFNHGYSVYLEANTVQCEELASHGYIVLSIGHQGEGSYELPNGEVITMDKDMQADFLVDFSNDKELFPNYATWLTKEGTDATFEQHYTKYKEMMDSQPRILAHMDVWLQDCLVALEMLLNPTEQGANLVSNHIDKDKIGAFGMSYGGAAALGLTHSCDLIKASANLDGFYYNSKWSKPFSKPTLMMQHDSMQVGPHLTFPFLNAEHDSYLVTVKQSTHNNFTDYTDIMAENEIQKIVIDEKEVEFKVLGDIDPDKMQTIMNTLLLDFFNKYIHGSDSRYLDTDDSLDDVILLRK
ncbi:hypothetical protein [Paenibacillus arenosi]|uniref:Uncharacterized protein n=1 Tax=Paenibacillus arenosi TaxID=2774142 RepID=A0ABR9B3R7_9BACL|nr:hypothetical protein [Paenibacillus arenosi]MBD8500969.1 hypothetical protein [Paenibacillus arenosi]